MEGNNVMPDDWLEEELPKALNQAYPREGRNWKVTVSRLDNAPVTAAWWSVWLDRVRYYGLLPTLRILALRLAGGLPRSARLPMGLGLAAAFVAIVVVLSARQGITPTGTQQANRTPQRIVASVPTATPAQHVAPTATPQQSGNKQAVKTATAIPTNIIAFGGPTETPIPIDTTTSVSPTDTPAPGQPTDTPAPGQPTDTPAPGQPTDTPTPVPPTGTAMPTPTGTTQPPGWSDVAALPIARDGLAAATDPHGNIYAVIGQNANSFDSAMIEKYNPGANTWTMVATLPPGTERFNLAATGGRDGRIYVMGGFRFGALSNAMQVYTPQSNLWANIPNMPTGRYKLSAIMGQDGRIYVMGGCKAINCRPALTKVEVYSPATNAWTVATPMLTARYDFATALDTQGRIYVMGGQGSNGAMVRTVDVYNPNTNVWTTVSTIPTPRTRLAAVTCSDGRIYVVGGYDNVTGHYLNTVEAYTPASNTWTHVPGMAVGRDGMAVAMLPGPYGAWSMYVIGGETSRDVATARVEVYGWGWRGV